MSIPSDNATRSPASRWNMQVYETDQSSNGRVHGELVLTSPKGEEHRFDFVSGPYGKGALPGLTDDINGNEPGNASYDLGGMNDSSNLDEKFSTRGRETDIKYWIPLGNDPNVKGRNGFGIHPNSGNGTLGCVGIVPEDAERFHEVWEKIPTNQRPAELDVLASRDPNPEFDAPAPDRSGTMLASADASSDATLTAYYNARYADMQEGQRYKGMGMNSDSPHVDKEQAAIRETQELLRDAGYPANKFDEKGNLVKAFGDNKDGVDGKFGPATKAAVEKFQRENGLEVTGRLDQQQLDMLREKAADCRNAGIERPGVPATPHVTPPRDGTPTLLPNHIPLEAMTGPYAYLMAQVEGAMSNLGNIRDMLASSMQHTDTTPESQNVHMAANFRSGPSGPSYG